MRVCALALAILIVSGCASSPDEDAADRFESCMDSTLGSVGPFTYGSQEARLKAAEICKDVMSKEFAQHSPAVQSSLIQLPAFDVTDRPDGLLHAQ